jgi:hypothetical protein
MFEGWGTKHPRGPKMKIDKKKFDIVFSRKGSRELFHEIVWAYSEEKAQEYLEVAYEDFENIISIDLV